MNRLSTFSYSDRPGHHSRRMADFDFEARIAKVRADSPLPAVVGASVKLMRAGDELKGCCPFHADRSPSFTIFAGGERFHCFGCGASGDVLDYVQRADGVSLVEALERLGAGLVPQVAAPAVEDRGGERSGEALEIWQAAEPATGTLVETYLRSRALTLMIPPSVRFARLGYGRSGNVHPVLVAAVVTVDGQLCGIQRTYLKGDGTGKADVPKAKLSLGRVAGGTIRLADAAEQIIVCEGLEDGLTINQETHRPVWVAAGASMLPAIRFPACVKSVAIGGDDDDAGRAAARKAAEAFAWRGLRTSMFFPTAAKDFNQELMGAQK